MSNMKPYDTNHQYQTILRLPGVVYYQPNNWQSIDPRVKPFNLNRNSIQFKEDMTISIRGKGLLDGQTRIQNSVLTTPFSKVIKMSGPTNDDLQLSLKV